MTYSKNLYIICSRKLKKGEIDLNRYSLYINTEELKKARNKKQKTYEGMAQEMGFKSPISYYNI